MIALTGATGQLGHYVLQDLLNTVPASQIVAIVRNPAKARRSASRAWLSAGRLQRRSGADRRAAGRG